MLAGETLQNRKILRFIHASNLHLERSVEEILEGPAHWEERMFTISKRAADRLFERVIAEEVDFLLLSGEILNANLASPDLFLYLLEQFGRLKEAGIKVYWAGGEFDSPEDWPSVFPLPDNVYQFPSNSVQEVYYFRHGESQVKPAAKLVGMSRNQGRRQIRVSEFPVEPGGVYTIAVTNGDVEPETLSSRRFDFWALGGQKRRSVFYGNPRKKGLDGKPIPLEQTGPDKRDKKELTPLPYCVHYPGALVARSPKDTGTFGAVLVEITFGEDPEFTFFPCSPIRWVNDQITLEPTDDAGKLADEIRERVKQYRATQKNEDDLMINWFIDVAPGHIMSILRRGTFTQDLLSELRALYAKEPPLTWSVGIAPLLPDTLPTAMYDQQTILGDFLRSIKHLQNNTQETVDLQPYLPKDISQFVKEGKTETQVDTFFKELLLTTKIETENTTEEGHTVTKTRIVQTDQQAATQTRVLREAILVGLELLGGEEQKPSFAITSEP